MAITIAPFSGIVTPSGLTALDMGRILDRITLLKAIIPDNTADPGVAPTYAPDFDNMPPAAAARIRTELTAFYNAVSGATTISGLT
jgi:hypothetical protein